MYIKQPCFFYHFDKIKSLSAKAFVEKLQEDFPKLETIVVGYDFCFGYKKEGNSTHLDAFFDGEVVVVDEVKSEEISVHSRTIKSYIAQGNIALVNQLLGRRFSIDGEVVTGQGLGKTAFFPTLNLKVYDYDLPKEGVYATRTTIDGKWLNSVTFLGHRVTTDGSYAVETHILGESLEEVRGTVWIEFIAFIRQNEKFETFELLKEEIKNDIEKAEQILKKEE